MRTPWEQYGPAPIVRGNFVARGRHFTRPCLAPAFGVSLCTLEHGDVGLRGEFADPHAALRRCADLPWTPDLEAVLGDYDRCARLYVTDEAFRARMGDYDRRIWDSGAAARMGLVAGDEIDATLHRVRLSAAQHEIDRMHAEGRAGPALTLLRLFMDMHLLSHLRIAGSARAPAWTFARPAPWRFPWFGHLPDLGAEITMHADFLVARRDKTVARADYIMLFVEKMIPHPCASRNTRQKIEGLCRAYEDVFDTVMDALLVALLGNYPGARADRTIAFRTKAWIVESVRELVLGPRERALEWMGRNANLVFFATKMLFRLNLQKISAFWSYYAAHYNYDSHYAAAEDALAFARDTLDARGAPFELGALENETLGAFHTMGTLSFCKLRKGSFMHTIMYMRMRGHLMHAQKCIDGWPGVERHRADLARFLEFVGDARSVFWTPDEPYPLFEPSLRAVLDRFAAFQATLRHDWPCTELLEYVGADRVFLGRVQLFFVMYETDDTPDNSCDKYVRQLLNEHPRECMMMFYIQERVHHIRSICVIPLPPHVRDAQRDAVRRRYHASLSDGDPPYATRFVACRACRRVYNFVANPALIASCTGRPIAGESKQKRCGSPHFRFDELGRPFCSSCGKPGVQPHRDNGVMGLDLKNKNWAFRHADGAMLCLRCDEPLMSLEGLGNAILFRGTRYQLCSRCGVWTTYEHNRDTTYGVLCGCDTHALPQGYGRAGGAGTGFECLVCRRVLERLSAVPVFYVADDGRIEQRHACDLHAGMHRQLWDARRVREAVAAIGFDRRGAMVHQTPKPVK